MSNRRHNSRLRRVLESERNSFDPALQSLTEIELLTPIKQFYKDKALGDVVDLKLLKRGALLAQNPDQLEQTRANPNQPHHDVLLDPADKILTNIEQDALNRENSGAIFKREGLVVTCALSKSLIVTLATCAIGAVVQGWSQQSIVGANLDWPEDLSLATRLASGRLEFNNPKSLRLFAVVNAIPYFAASALGAWVSDPLTDKWGRRTALFIAGLCSFAAPIGGAYSQKWWHLLICRIIQGIGMGAKSSVVPILESEVSPPRMRAKLLVSWQTFVAVGIFLGASTNCIFAGHWRLQLGIAFIPAVPLLCLCYVIPESPRWLMKKHKYKKACKALMELRETPLQACRDFYLIRAQLKIEDALFSRVDLDERDYRRLLIQSDRALETPLSPGFFTRLGQLVTIARNRRAVIGSCIVMSAQQFSGINIYAFLATTIFSSSEIDDMKTLWFTFGFGLANAVFSALAYFVINKLGRRTLLLWSLILMFPFLILTGHYLDTRKGGSPPIGSVIALVIIYTAVYSPGAGVIPFMYASEVFPLVHWEAGMSLAVSVNFVLAGALTMAVPQYYKSNKNEVLLGSFAGLDAIAAVGVWLFMRSPEEAKSLEEMNYLFIPPSMSYVKYQITIALPWVVKQPFRLLDISFNPKLPFDTWRSNTTRELGFELEGDQDI